MKRILAILLLCAGVSGYGQYNLTIEQSTPAAAPGTVYRFYVEATDPSDKMSGVFGNDQSPLVISCPDGIFNSPMNTSWNASGLHDMYWGFWPDLQDDSYATIGLDGPASWYPGAEDPSLTQDASLSPTVSGFFQVSGSTNLNVNTLTGASWYVLNTASNALPTNGRWLIAQITTTGEISGTLNYQIFPLGEGANQIQKSVSFDGIGWGGPCGDLPYPFGCTDEAACNFDPCASQSDDSCLYLDDAGECTQPCLDPGDSNCVDPVLGCTYAMAINYDEDAMEDDGSCLFEPCGDGTIWDETLNKCIVANPSDTDFDGCVGINDFLVHLSLYGSGCGPEPAWACGEPLEYQGYDYETVQIGEQCWFAENLRAGNYRNGDTIPSQLDEVSWASTNEGALANYGDDGLTCYNYSPTIDGCNPEASVLAWGKYYNWFAIQDSRALCPSGWFIPNDVEWSAMEVEIGMSFGETIQSGWRGFDEGNKLKAQNGWFGGGGGLDEFDFGAVSAGHRHYLGNYFDDSGTDAIFWTASSQNSTHAWYRALSWDKSQIQRVADYKTYGHSIRCIKDTE